MYLRGSAVQEVKAVWYCSQVYLSASSSCCAHSPYRVWHVGRSFYGDLIPGHVLAERLATFIHVFTLYWYVR